MHTSRCSCARKPQSYFTYSIYANLSWTASFLFLWAALCWLTQRPHGLYRARLLCPWVFSKQEYWRLLCPWGFSRQDYMPTSACNVGNVGSIPEFGRGFSQLRDRTQVSHIAGGFFTISATREAFLFLQQSPKQQYERWKLLRNRKIDVNLKPKKSVKI